MFSEQSTVLVTDTLLLALIFQDLDIIEQIQNARQIPNANASYLVDIHVTNDCYTTYFEKYKPMLASPSIRYDGTSSILASP